MRITVHNKDVFPFPFEDGLTVAAGDEIFIGIRKVMIIIYQLTYGVTLDTTVTPISKKPKTNAKLSENS
jgi:hypothetical protein